MNEEQEKNPLEDVFGGNFMLEGAMEILLPKIQQFAEPLSKKLDEYLGDDERMICIIRPNINTKAIAVVINRNKGSSTIICSEIKEEKKFLVDKEGMEHVYKTSEFVQALVSGDLTKLSEQK